MTAKTFPTLAERATSRDAEATALEDLHRRWDLDDITNQVLLGRYVKAAAERHNAPYPQYDGYWDGWAIVRMTTDITTKGGEAFKRGDITIATWNAHLGFGGDWTVYSWRLGWNVALGYAVSRVGGRFGEGPTV